VRISLEIEGVEIVGLLGTAEAAEAAGVTVTVIGCEENVAHRANTVYVFASVSTGNVIVMVFSVEGAMTIDDVFEFAARDGSTMSITGSMKEGNGRLFWPIVFTVNIDGVPPCIGSLGAITTISFIAFCQRITE